MAGSNFNLDSGAMTKFIDEMKQYHASIDGEVNRAQGEAQGLAGSMTGQAGGQLQSSFQQFAEAAKKMNDTLLLNAENLQSVNQKYGHVEEDQLSQLQKAGGLLQWQA